MRIGRGQQMREGGERLAKVLVRRLREDVLGCDRNGHVLAEAGAMEAEADGQPHGERHEAQGHIGRDPRVDQDGLRVENEGVRRRGRDSEKREAVGESVDRREADTGEQGPCRHGVFGKDAERRFQEPGMRRVRRR